MFTEPPSGISRRRFAGGRAIVRPGGAKRQTPALSLALASAILLAACSSLTGSGAGTPTGTGPPTPSATGDGVPGSIPPAPPSSPGGSATAPVVWVGGTVDDVSADAITIREGSGPAVTMTRLAEGATSFYRASGGAWRRLATQAQIPAGGQACVETLMDGQNLLALRVFLGTGCGPA